jgi:hypothetical protein
MDIIGVPQIFLQYAPNEHIMVSNHSLLSNACCIEAIWLTTATRSWKRPGTMAYEKEN